MGKVIFGAIVGALLGWFIGWIPSYHDARWEVVQAGTRSTVELSYVLRPISMMIGMAAGGIIGAIAGRTAADPTSTPLPKWFRVTLLVLFFGLVLLYVVGAIVSMYQLSSKTVPKQERDPLQEREPARKNPGE